PKIEEYGSEIFAVLHVVEIAGDELRVGEVNVFTGPNFVLSIRNRTEQGFLGVRARCEREPELLRHGSGYVLYALMDAVVDRYSRCSTRSRPSSRRSRRASSPTL